MDRIPEKVWVRRLTRAERERCLAWLDAQARQRLAEEERWRQARLEKASAARRGQGWRKGLVAATSNGDGMSAES